MSQRAYEKFLQALEDDPQLAYKLREHVAEAGETNSVDATVEFGQRHGYKFDAMDVRRAM